MKRLMVIPLLLLLTVTLTACGGKKEDNPWSEGASGKEKMEESTTEETAMTDKGQGHQKKEEAAADGQMGQAELQNGKSNVEPLEVLLTDRYLEKWSETESGEWDESYTRLCMVTWQELVLSAECARDYPQLAKTLQEKNKEFEGHSHDSMDYLLPLAQEAYDYEIEFGSGSFYPFSGDSKLSVQRGDNLIVSVREDFNEYSGGVHGMYGTIGMNYDSVTGEELLITDVLTDISSLPAMLSEKIMETYGDEYETYESLQGYLKEEYEPEDYNWTMSYQGITFYFNPYEIASYSEGMIRTTLWFDEIPELVKEEYTEVPVGGYAMALPLGQHIDVDLNPNDGKRDWIAVTSFYKSEEEKEYGFQRLSIGRSDYWHQGEEDYGYEFIPYLVCVGEPGKERYYIYVEGNAENDFSTLYIYDLNGKDISACEPIPGVGFTGCWEEKVGEDGTYYNKVLLEPRSFELGTRIHILGTWTGRKIYVADSESGIPEPETEYYSIKNNEYPLVSKLPIEVLMLPGKSREELPAGTSFYILRTDGESYVDACLEDGRECRIEVEYVDWEYRLKGISEWDCFEELFYAG